MSKQKKKTGKKPVRPAESAAPPQPVPRQEAPPPPAGEPVDRQPTAAPPEPIAAPRGRHPFARYRRVAAWIVGGAVLLKLGVLAVVLWLTPDVEDLTRTDRLLPTSVYTLDGVRLTTIDDPAKRQVTPPDSVDRKSVV